jgi:hypothetical protein
MNAFPGVFFHDNLIQANSFIVSVYVFYMHRTANAKGSCELRYLITFRKVSIEIVLAGKVGTLYDSTVASQSHFYRLPETLDARPGQSAGMPQAYRADEGIRLGAVLIPVAAESFRSGQELCVYLQSDYRFVFAINVFQGQFLKGQS